VCFNPEDCHQYQDWAALGFIPEDCHQYADLYK
jgi:hypothetical protein